MSAALEVNLTPDEERTPLVRKLGAMCLLSQEETTFLEGLHNNTLEIKAGSDLIEEGEDLRTMFIVMEGWCIRYVCLSDGRRQILSFALPGDIIGLHINFKARATFSVGALTNAKLAAVDPRRVLEISQKHPIVASGLSWCAAQELTILGEQTVRLGRQSARERLAHLLLELWHRQNFIGQADGMWLEAPMRQHDLADALGLTNVYISKLLQGLRQDGMIEQKSQRIRLAEYDALVKLGRFDPERYAPFEV